jgi:uncharacterized membrane protein (DUF4010 family)
MITLHGWKILNAGGELPIPTVKNPTELKTAISFGLLYALVLLASAWLQDIAGNRGLFTSSRWLRALPMPMPACCPACACTTSRKFRPAMP